MQVMLDADLAEFYNVETKALNQAVKRNSERFPEHFMFQLTKGELENLKSQIVTSSWGGCRYFTYGCLQKHLVRHSGESRNPVFHSWFPAFVGTMSGPRLSPG